MVEELERKKQLILSIVMKDHDKYLESSEAITTFSENYNKVRRNNILNWENNFLILKLTCIFFQIFSWLVSSVESFLHETNSMGANLAKAREFLESHKALQRDLRVCYIIL